ncbi:AsmA family protein [Rhizobium sp. SGZ-381]|uniref:AsmA family protein n=1 Tax=Rhizobium sp. SGZ-381 TaxID=3342800 RepID=UPI00366B7890
MTPRKKLARMALYTSAGLLALTMLFRLAAPILVSSTLVRESMEDAVENWLGHDVTIEGTPELEFFPRPVVTLTGLTIRQESRPDAPVLGRIARLSAGFSVLQALRGQPVFQDFNLTAPDITMTADASGKLDWSSDGILSTAVRQAIDPQQATATDTALADAGDTVMGDVTITAGRLSINGPEGKHLSIEDINGTIDWPKLSSAAEMQMAATIRGKALELHLSSSQPLLLLGGRGTDIDATIKSTLFSGRFAGRADLTRYAFFSGDLELSIPSVSDVVTWANLPVHTADGLRDLTLSARLVTLNQVLRFDRLSIEANGTWGTGVMDLSMQGATAAPRVTGTLAFDTVDLGALVQAISDDREASGSQVTQKELPFERQLGFDVRFSAKTARLGSLTLANSAVSILSDTGRAEIEILDSDLLNGSLTGQIRMQVQPQPSTRILMSARKVDFEALAHSLSLTGPVLAATGSVDLDLRLGKPLAQARPADLTGTVRLSTGAGQVTGLDLASLRRLATGSSYFALNRTTGGSTSFDSLVLSAELASGSAELQEAVLSGTPYSLRLSGVVPYETKSLSLAATILDATEPDEPRTVFIGGAWPNPVLWPAPSAPKPAIGP